MSKASNRNSNDNKFITDTFLEAAYNKAFYHCWMTADTWVELIVQYYKPPMDKRFTSMIRECISRKVLTNERVRSFSKRAHEYICAYYVLHEMMTQQAEGMEQGVTARDQNAAVPVKIEVLVKQFKTHRCGLDFDHGFIKAMLKKSDDDKE
jgi:hypothetical protein